MMDRLTLAVEQAMREAARIAVLPRFLTAEARILVDKGVGDAAGDEPVTAADRECEAILAERLSALVPEAGIVGEEAVHAQPALLDKLASGPCWLIDPLDGTGNFAAGKGPFGLLVAFVEDGMPTGGWILDPLSGRFCSARSGHGAHVDGVPFRAPDATRARPLVAITRLFPDAAARARLMDALAVDHDLVDSPRCAADQYPRVATGGNDVTLFTRTLAWDHAAGVVFLNEAGGQARRADGTAYRCDSKAEGLIAATSPRQWDAMANRLTGLDIDLATAGRAA